MEVKQVNNDLPYRNNSIADIAIAIPNISIPDTIIGVLGFDGRLTSISASVEKLLGVTTDQVGSRFFAEYLHPDDRERLHAAFAEVKSGKMVTSIEARLVNMQDGVTRWTVWSAQAFPDDQSVVIVGRDITDDRIREEKLRQLQKMEAIGQLTGGIAHDFNNMLAAISGSLEMIAKQVEQGRTDRIEKYVSSGRTATGRAAQVTQRLLAFARRQPLDPVPVDVNNLIESMRDLLIKSAGSTVSITTSLVHGVWTTTCDQNQLANGLLNCVINSRDAFDNGGVIEIATKNITKEECRLYDVPRGEYVAITITDNGVGMEEDVIQRAFDPFFTTKPIGQGTGLGLSMLYGFVNQSGGHLKLVSSPNEGTTASIYLPRTCPDPVATVEEEGSLLPQLAQPGQTVMIVEDEELVRDILVEVMQGCGFAIIEAEDANTALPHLTDPEVRIDLLLSDVGLPGMNGRQLAEIARQHRPDLKILFVTGFAPNATTRETFLAPGMDMMTKPFEVDKVAERVAVMLK